jgi:hypothetical protein
MRIQLEVNSRLVKKVLISLVVILLVGTGAFVGYKKLANKNPLPLDIKQQLSFPTIYPKGSLQDGVNQDSISYHAAEKTLNYTVQAAGTEIILSEQPASGNSSKPNLVYYQSLGLHPVTEIQTDIGLAVLVNFYTSGDLNSVGQDAVLANNGTLLIAHPAKNLSPEAWKSFFNDLHLYK